MLFAYDHKGDILYIELRKALTNDSMDIEEGVTALLDDAGHIVGLELLDASERVGKEHLYSVSMKDLAWEPATPGN